MKDAIEISHVCLILLLVFLASITFTGCPATTMSPSEAQRISGDLSTQPPGGADDFIIVDCRLPGQIRQLGQRMVYVTRRRAVKTTAKDCAIRGGEFPVPGQSDYTMALMVWLPAAEEGNMEAQYYVGEIYQRGLGATPNYPLAAEWYRKSAAQGFAKAQMNLGYLYEKGLGVGKDPQQALRWYRRATGLSDTITLDENALSIEERHELQELREEVKRRREETRRLQPKLDQIRKDLKGTRLKLEQRSSDIENEAQRQDVARLKFEIAGYEAEIDALQNKLAQNKARMENLPAPRIEIYAPSVQTTRGVHYEERDRNLKKRPISGMVWAMAGLASFKVNQKVEPVAPDGKFKVWVPLKPTGETTVHIVAVDLRGRRTSITRRLAPSVGIYPSDLAVVDYPPINFGRYHALIIGNIDYRKLTKLKTAVNDAKRIDQVLRYKYGFNTELLLDASRDDIMTALNRFRQTLTKDDNLLIYYAGHGILDPENNRGYWLPIDADPNVNVNWISDITITDQLNIMKAKEVLIVADSCYSGILTRGTLARLESAQSAEVRYNWIEELSKGRARMVLTSGELAPVLDTVGGDHSIFAKVLLEVLESNDQIIEGDRLYQEINALVAYESEKFGLPQMPLYSAIIQAGHESGDFIFVPKKYQ